MLALVRGAAHILHMILGVLASPFWAVSLGTYSLGDLGSLAPAHHYLGQRSCQELRTGGLSAFSSSLKEARGPRRGWRMPVLQWGPF